MHGLNRLLELQELDSGVDRLAARRRALESGAEVASARSRADAAEAQLGETRLSIDALGRDQQRLEHEIESLTQKAGAEEKRLYDGSIANAKELESLQHEIQNLGRRRSEREDELLEILEQREELERRAKEEDASASEVRGALDELAGSAASELEQIGADLRAKAEERERLAPVFDPELLELYEDLRRQKKGVGAAALVDGVCGGCHEKLSAVELDRVKRAEVPRCEYCRRILVL
ncbi:MAG TPA: C4-type zinc ribbon domain-containing protein [Actinomycetota bacterium]|jgi:predicted  nucleic acid-binding Zn-ribbon protein